MDRLSDAGVCPAAADHRTHRLLDLIVGRTWRLRKESGRLHHLPALTIPALWHGEIAPGPLHRVVAGAAQPLDGHDVLSLHGRQRSDAGHGRAPVHVYRAGTAGGHATSELRSRESELIA